MNIKLKESTLGSPAGHLLLIGCSSRKAEGRGKLPAVQLYDGSIYRVIRSFLNRRGWPPGLQIKIISAKYGLLDATDLIENYDQRLDVEAARKMNPEVLASLVMAGAPATVFVNLGKDYCPAVEGLNQIFPEAKVIHAKGGIGLKMSQMKLWLDRLSTQTAAIKGASATRSYMYFFPDWDDYVTVPFVHESATGNAKPREKMYAHEIFGDKTPYDGMLVSLAQRFTGKGTLSRLDPESVEPGALRRLMKIPDHLVLFGDCGAFSYASEEAPPFSPEEAAKLYEQFGFDAGASVDHIPLPEIVVKGKDGRVRKSTLSEAQRRGRMELTVRNAEAFIGACRKYQYNFVPIGAIQGIDLQSYVRCVHEYIDMGYRHIALGGLVPKTDAEILAICAATRAAIQTRTKTEIENIWLHLFGILRPKIQSCFRVLGVSSFDSASYLRKAWLRSNQNYLSPKGDQWYSTIRVPLSTSKRLQNAAEEKMISPEDLTEMERRCLVALAAFDGTEATHKEVMESVNKYGPLLERRGEDNHFIEKHNAVLTDRPWEKCRCPICRQLGIDVVVFRGTGRNKRRGFHNTWVFYHKILHGK
jgi:hypothetical protein